MKFRLILDTTKDEEVVITAKERTPLIDQIEELVTSQQSGTLVAYTEDDTLLLPVDKIACCMVSEGKTFAIDIKGNQLRLKQRLYELEEHLPEHFIRINKSCIANIRQLERFAATYSGGINAVFKCGYTDYVSRRCFAAVKRRLGI
jgi:DNA-binding LytR/AlgR family response regulator